jgi:uncharacterized protein (TIGR00730 family)
MTAICVFLGSSPGANPLYTRAAADMGRELAQRDITCVYGGSRTGLMRVLADSALEAGGRVIGITVTALRDRENFHPGLTGLHVVPTMHQRKALMAELSDGFVALPGGIGTFEEFFEVFTWGKLGFHSKPCGYLDINGYYAPLDALLETAEREGFLSPSDRSRAIRAGSPPEMLDRICRAMKLPGTPDPEGLGK